MKIIVVSTLYPTKSSPNSGIFIHQQIKALKELGVECHVIQAVNWFPPFGLHIFHQYWRKGYNDLKNMYVEFEGIKIHHPKMFIKLPRRIFPEDMWEIMGKTIASYIKKRKELQKSDLIYSHFLCFEGYASTFIKKQLNIPLVAIARGDDVHAFPEGNSKLIRNLKHVFANADLILATSKGLAKDTQKWMEKEKVRSVETVYNGIDVHKFQPVTSAEEKQNLKVKYQLDLQTNYLMCIATPVTLKGWVELFESIKVLKPLMEGWKLIAVAPDFKHHLSLDLKVEAIQRSIEEFILFPGRLSHDQIAELMKCSDIFILPSYNEGLSNSVMEAMSTGLATITTEVGGHGEIIFSGINGMLVKPKSVDELVSSLKVLLTNTELRDSMGEKARESILGIGTFKDNAKKLFNYLNKVLEINDYSK